MSSPAKVGQYVRHHRHEGVSNCDNISKVRKVLAIRYGTVSVYKTEKDVTITEPDMKWEWDEGDFEVLSPEETTLFLLAQ